MDFESPLSSEILQKDNVELGEDEQQIEGSVIAIREWIKKQPHLLAMPTGKTQYNKHPILFNDPLLCIT